MINIKYEAGLNLNIRSRSGFLKAIDAAVKKDLRLVLVWESGRKRREFPDIVEFRAPGNYDPPKDIRDIIMKQWRGQKISANEQSRMREHARRRSPC